eukprot:m51a1_g2491 hypothetical protein (353) ;mRNA; r:91287-92400
MKTGLVIAALLGLALCVLADCNLPTGWSNIYIQNHNKNRRVLVYRPQRKSEFRKPSLWIHLHGMNMAPEDFKNNAFHTVAEKEGGGYIVAMPEGTNRFWDTYGNEDLDLLKATAQNLQGRGCGDPQRTYLSGFSLGAWMSFTTACRLPGVFAAFAPSGFSKFGGNLGTCNNKAPVWYWAGSADNIGNPANGNADQCFQWWAQHNGCGAQGAKKETKKIGWATVQCKYSTCTGAGLETNVCVVDGQGHWWLTGSEDYIWAFFKRHTLSGHDSKSSVSPKSESHKASSHKASSHKSESPKSESHKASSHKSPKSESHKSVHDDVSEEWNPSAGSSLGSVVSHVLAATLGLLLLA